MIFVVKTQGCLLYPAFTESKKVQKPETPKPDESSQKIQGCDCKPQTGQKTEKSS